MRFKAKLAPEQVSLLHSVIIPLSKCCGNNGKVIVLFDNNDIKFSCKGGNNNNAGNNNNNQNTDGIVCYAELLAMGGIFVEHRIESAATNNRIVMEIDIQLLRAALKSILGNSNTMLQQNQYTVLKLAKRQNVPCLCLDGSKSIPTTSIHNNNESVTNLNNTNNNNSTIQIHHSIPVRILRPNEFDDYYLPPIIPLPDVQLEFSSASSSSTWNSLRTILDKLRPISSTVYLDASMMGELTIRVDTDGASIRTFFNKLNVRHDGCKTTTPNSPATTTSRSSTMKVDTKKLYTCLQWQQQSSSHNMMSTALLCFITNEMLVVHVTIQPNNIGFLTYYIPVYYIDPNDEL